MPDIRGWIRRHRYGGITGLNQMDANLKMLAVGFSPLVIGVFLVQIFVPADLTPIFGMLVLVGEVGWIAMVVMKAKSSGASLIPFPQSHFRFPDGGVQWLDLKIKPGGITEVCKFSDGSKGYHVQFTERYEHQDPKRPSPYVFDYAFWKVQDKWDTAIQRLSHGEFFHENVFIDHPACEALSIWVKEWVETESGWAPLCAIGDCTLTYQEFLKGKLRTPSQDTYLMPFRKAQRTVETLLTDIRNLETALEVERAMKGYKFKQQVDRTLSTVREGVHTIDDTSEPLLRRIFNFGNIWKAMLVIGFVVLILWILGVIQI